MILSAQSLSKRYGAAPGYDAVRDANLELRPGEFVSVVGRSGSGKSTLMAMLGALTQPTRGKVVVDGTDIWTLPESELARFRARYIGFVFQFPSLLSNLTAVDNVALPALLGRNRPAEKAYAHGYDLLACVGLADRADVYPGRLSGGEQRRVAIARALINSPALLLADEPTSDLDEDTEADIIDLLVDLQRRHAFGFVLVTHNLRLAERAQRTYEMRQGALAATGLPHVVVAAERERRFGPPTLDPAPTMPAPARVRLGGNLLRGVQVFLVAAAVVFAGILAADFGVEKYQAMRVRERTARLAALRRLALNSLRGDIQSVTDLGDGRYELKTDLQNVGDGKPIYVMGPDMRAYAPGQDGLAGIAVEAARRKRERRREDRGQAELSIPVRCASPGLRAAAPELHACPFFRNHAGRPSSVPKGDVFEGKDNYHVYLKPPGVSDETVARGMRFSGKPPVWIPMPPH